MKVERIDETDRYSFEYVSMDSEPRSDAICTTDKVRTFFVHRGIVEVQIESPSGRDVVKLGAGQGFVAAPGAKYCLASERGFFGVQSSSYVGEGGMPVEIFDDGSTQKESSLVGHRIITNPKRVEKPWGHELWISWFRDYHVLKQIGMNAGNRCSLQLHSRKLETNYLVEGEADVIGGYCMNLALDEEGMKRAIAHFNWDRYTERKGSGMHWTILPGTVHRVIAATDYLAYETSTPELDDVIRLSDDSGRESGRIAVEHGGRDGE